MDYLDYNFIKGIFLNALKSKYNVSEDIKFSRLNKHIFEVSLKGEKVLGVDYFVREDRMVDIEIFNYNNFYTSNRRNIIIFKCSKDNSLFIDVIIKMLEEVKFKTVKETTVVNNAQEIIEITKKAKEENIKKDIEYIESKILEAARNGSERLLFSLSGLKTDFSQTTQFDNDIVNHFKKRGFECSINDSGYLGRYLKISWGE